MEEGKYNRDEIFSKSVRAGKRTYFFDVKTTRGNDLYLTITESKKRFNKEGDSYYEKHKLFLYKEDFEKFEDGLKEVLEKISELRASGKYEQVKVNHDTNNASEPVTESSSNSETSETNEFTNVNFDDLGTNHNPE